MLSKKDKKDIIDLAKAGKTYVELGRRFGVTYQRVQQICNGAIPPRLDRLTEAEIDKAVELASRGLCVRQISREIGRSDWGVKRSLAKRGVKAVNQADIFGADKRGSAVEMVRRGATYAEAAEALDMTRNAVSGACGRAGVKVGRRPDAKSRAMKNWWAQRREMEVA